MLIVITPSGIDVGVHIRADIGAVDTAARNASASPIGTANPMTPPWASTGAATTNGLHGRVLCHWSDRGRALNFPSSENNHRHRVEPDC
jgi:hypothetical protein